MMLNQLPQDISERILLHLSYEDKVTLKYLKINIDIISISDYLNDNIIECEESTIEETYEKIVTDDIKITNFNEKDLVYKKRYIINYVYSFSKIFKYDNNVDNINIFLKKQKNYIDVCLNYIFAHKVNKFELFDYIFYNCVYYIDMFYNLAIDYIIEEKYLLDNLHDDKIQYIKKTITKHSVFILFKLFIPDNTILQYLTCRVFKKYKLERYNNYMTIFINLIKRKKIFCYKGVYQNEIDDIYKTTNTNNILLHLIDNISCEHKVVDINSEYHIKLLMHDNKKVYYNDEEIFKNYLNNINFYIYSDGDIENKINKNITRHTVECYNKNKKYTETTVEYFTKDSNIKINYDDNIILTGPKFKKSYILCDLNNDNINNIDYIYKLLKYYNCEFSMFHKYNNKIPIVPDILDDEKISLTLCNKNIFINQYISEYYNLFECSISNTLSKLINLNYYKVFGRNVYSRFKFNNIGTAIIYNHGNNLYDTIFFNDDINIINHVYKY